MVASLINVDDSARYIVNVADTDKIDTLVRDDGVIAAVGAAGAAGIVVAPYTGAAAIDITTAFAANWELIAITMHLGAAGTTTEDLVVNLDANDGAAYDVKMFELDLSPSAVVDLQLNPGDSGGMETGTLQRFYEAGDEINITWPNTETQTYGIRVVARVV